MISIERTVSLLGVLGAIGCGGSSTSDNAAGGSAGTGASSSGGTSSGGTSSGGTSSGGTSSGGTAGGGGATGGAAGAGQCGPQAKSCGDPSDCVLSTPNCCLCGMPELTDYEAINSSFTQECGCSGSLCQCAMAMNPNLAATCNAGTCEGFDVRQSSYSACTADTDCSLRFGLECCEACQGGEFNLVAVNNQGGLSQAVCGSDPVACPDCAPQYPANKKAACVANHCQVVDQ